MSEFFEGITIDPASAADLDDAIWIDRTQDGWTARIAFPRLTRLVGPGEPADGAARERLFTLYLSGGHAKQMLPADVVAKASLTRGQDKPVFLVTIALDRSFRPVTVDCRPATFRSRGQLTYEAASALVRSGKGPIGEMLSRAKDFAHGLFEARRASGAIAFYDLERGIAFDEEGAVILLTGQGHVAEMIVREFMVLANSMLAAWAAKEGIPILYRNHGHKEARTREQLLADLEGVAADADIQVGGMPRMMARATTGVEPKGHYALNLPAYAWFTSPLRRYADLVNQRMIETHMDGRAARHDVADLEGIASAINEHQASLATRTTEAFKKRAARIAGQRVDRGDVAAATEGEFTELVKYVAENPKDVTEGVVEESLRRIAGGGLGSKDTTRLLLVGGRIADAVLARMKEHPHETFAVFGYGTSALGWSQPVFEDDMRGPDNERLFISKCILRTPTGEYTSPQVVRPNKKAAQYAAASHVLAALAGTGSPEELSVASPAPRPETQGGVVGNHKGRLLEHFMKRQQPLPTFSVTDVGSVKSPLFEAVATAVVDGSPIATEPVRERTKKDAEKAAALAMLIRLGLATEDRAATPSEPPRSAPKKASASVPDPAVRTRLTNLCAQRKWGLPRFDVRSSGPSHSPRFTVVASVRIGPRTLRSGEMVAGSKKEAERQAAAQVLAEIERDPTLVG